MMSKPIKICALYTIAILKHSSKSAYQKPWRQRYPCPSARRWPSSCKHHRRRFRHCWGSSWCLCLMGWRCHPVQQANMRPRNACWKQTPSMQCLLLNCHLNSYKRKSNNLCGGTINSWLGSLSYVTVLIGFASIFMPTANVWL